MLNKTSLLEVTLIEAKNGSSSAVIGLLTSASESLRRGELISEGLADWLATAFDSIIDGEDVSKSLMLNKKRGRPQKLNDDMEEMIATIVHHTEKGRHKSTGKTSDKDGIYMLLAEEYGISDNQIEQIYKKYRCGFEAQEEVEREARLNH